MKTNAIAVGTLVAGFLAAPASTLHAQCPAGGAPALLPISPTITSTATGSTRLVADDGVAVSESPSALVEAQIYHPTASGWAVDAFVPIPNRIEQLSVRGDTIAAASRYGTSIVRRSTATGTWQVVFSSTDVRTLHGISVGPASLVMHGGTTGLKCYAIQPSGSLVLEQTIPSAPANAFGFGEKSAIDGEFLAVNSHSDSEAGTKIGAVYVYRRVGNQWTFLQKIIPEVGARTPGFGKCLAMRDGLLAIGSLHDFQNLGDGDPYPLSFSGGFVNVYAWNGTSFVQRAHLTHPRLPSHTPAGFGASVALRGSRLLVGAYRDDLYGPDSGAAYVFDFDGSIWQPRGYVGLADGAGGWLGTVVGLSNSSAIALTPLFQPARLGMVVFDECSLPPAPGETPRCIPGYGGLTSYILSWFQGDPWTDFDRNGHVTMDDLMAFLNAWMAGCP